MGSAVSTPSDQALVMRRYTFKVYPSATQERALDAMRRMHCDLYNALLQQRIEAYRRRGKTLSYYDQSKELTALRAELPEWRALSSNSMAATAQRLDRAMRAFFSRAKKGAGAASGFPRFKSGRDYPSIPFKKNRSGWSVELGETRGATLRIKGIDGAMRCRGRLPAPTNDVRSGDILWREGSWWLSIAVAMKPRRKIGSGEASIHLGWTHEIVPGNGHNGECLAGSDDGISVPPEDRITGGTEECDKAGADGRDSAGDGRGSGAPLGADGRDSAGDGRDLPEPPPLWQAAMSRRRKGSYRWRQAKILNAKHQGRAARRRSAALHVWTTGLVDRYAFLRVTMPAVREATNSAKGDARSWGAEVDFKAKMNRRLLDAAPATAAAMLEYKIAEAGGHIEITKDERHVAALPQSVVIAAKATRRAKRAVARTLESQP